MKPIPGQRGYFADRNGNIWSINSKDGVPRKLKPGLTRGYYGVSLSGKRSFYVHRLILQTFVGVCPDGMQSCHNNGKRSDNRLSNLRWDTFKNNHADMMKHGTRLMGENHHLSVLNELQVRIIRNYPKHYGDASYLTNVFKVSRRTIRDLRCITKRSWKHI